MGINIYIARLYLVEIIAEVSKFFDYKNHRKGTGALCEDSAQITD